MKKRLRRKHLSAALGLSLILSSLGGSFASAAILPSTVTPPVASWGYFVDEQLKGNDPKIGVLSGFGQLWAPGTSWNNGISLNESVLNANIQKVVDFAASRTSSEADAAYFDDRRKQSYSVIEGLGSLTDFYRTNAGATTTINDIPADATSKKYDDGGTDSGSTSSSLGNIVRLVQTIRNYNASTTQAKNYYNYPRPYRWKKEGSSFVLPTTPENNTSIIVPTLVPAISTTPATDGGFPSGHTNAGYLSAIAMAYAVPERFQELLTRASELGHNRILAGHHSPLDVMGGRVHATAITAAALYDPNNNLIKQAAYDDAHSKLLTQMGTAPDRFSDYAKNKKEYTERLTYGFTPIASTTEAMVVPKGAEVLLETRLPYLDSTQRRWVLATNGLPSGYPVLDDPEGWGRLNLFAAADGYGAFATDVTVTMDTYKGGFHAMDRWRNDISGTGKLTKQGTGTLKLQGNNTYSGGTQINEGILEGNSETAFGSGGMVNNGGTVIENVYGKMTIGGTYTQSANGTLELNLNGKDDLLEIKGALHANGKLRLNFTGNYVPNGVVTIINHGKDQRNGQFSSIETMGLPSEYKVNVIYYSDSIQLLVGTNDSTTPNTDTPQTPGGTTVNKDAGANPETKHEKSPSGQTVDHVVVDGGWLSKAISALNGKDAGKQSIKIGVTGNGDVAKVDLPMSVLADSKQSMPQSVISIQTDDGTAYNLPTSVIDTAKVAQTLGTDAKNVQISVNIQKVTGTVADQIIQKAKQNGVTLLGGTNARVIEFSITANAGGKTVEINNFGKTYVTRNLIIKQSSDPSTATAVLYDPATGEMTFVPAVFQNVGGNTQVTIKNRSNSIYTVVQSSKSFDDLNNHWSKADVGLMASKLLVKGRTDFQFAPDETITRAEFTSLLVRALGLNDKAAATFTDVNSKDWFAGAVGDAAKAGLIGGFEDGSFHPNDNISREQMAVMLSKAMDLVGKSYNVNGKQTELLGKFTDRSSISSWAQTAVAQAAGAGLVAGKTDNTFVAGANATRAEAVVMLKRFLQVAEFIN
ncbi:S-layer homology domain-containing protein [Paenibacillus sedimenti]|uniref:S-layer homology domain-containing protein n=1 Tax=Paenibacillus sedimenti TaxID=2770274 RepID=UPI001CB6D5FF|nr:S-layer homology domain-containing protein [Paenibacillus sedimenti]